MTGVVSMPKINNWIIFYLILIFIEFNKLSFKIIIQKLKTITDRVYSEWQKSQQ